MEARRTGFETDLGRLTSADTVEGARFFEKRPVDPPYHYLFG